MKLFKKHKHFFKIIWYLSLPISFIYALVDWYGAIIRSVMERNFIGIIFLFITQTLFLSLNGLLGAVLLTVALSITLFIPYLVIRGFLK
jgi:hypothetical protein